MSDRSFNQLLDEVRWLIASIKCDLAARRFEASLRGKGGFNPDQPRDDQGQWANDEGSENLGGIDAGIILTGGGRPGYPVHILEEDALGGHTIEKHVAKPEEYLKARVLGSRVNLLGIVTVGEKRAGSFPSLEAANKLVNSTIAQNQEKIDAFVAGPFPSVLPFMNDVADFESATGYEAYAPNDRAQPRMRPTYGVTVHIRRTDQDEKRCKTYGIRPRQASTFTRAISCAVSWDCSERRWSGLPLLATDRAAPLPAHANLDGSPPSHFISTSPCDERVITLRISVPDDTKKVELCKDLSTPISTPSDCSCRQSPPASSNAAAAAASTCVCHRAHLRKPRSVAWRSAYHRRGRRRGLDALECRRSWHNNPERVAPELSPDVPSQARTWPAPVTPSHPTTAPRRQTRCQTR